jgi:hypothetical protein
MTKEQKKEMKAKIKKLLPKEPPKPTVSLEDLDYQIIEVGGVYKKVRFDKIDQNKTNLNELLNKKKQK